MLQYIKIVDSRIAKLKDELAEAEEVLLLALLLLLLPPPSAPKPVPAPADAPPAPQAKLNAEDEKETDDEEGPLSTRSVKRMRMISESKIDVLAKLEEQVSQMSATELARAALVRTVTNENRVSAASRHAELAALPTHSRIDLETLVHGLPLVHIRIPPAACGSLKQPLLFILQ